MVVFCAPRLFSYQSPWALQTGNGNTLQRRRRLYKKINRHRSPRSGTTFEVRTLSSFSTPLIFHWSIPLMSKNIENSAFRVRSHSNIEKKKPKMFSRKTNSETFLHLGPQRIKSVRLFIQSSELAPPGPSPARVCCPPFGSGGGHTRLRKWGAGGANSEEGTDTLVM